MWNSLVLLSLNRMWSCLIPCTASCWSFSCVSDLSSCKRLWNLLALLWVLYLNVCCRKVLISSIVIGLADLLHSIVVRHVKGFMRVDSSLWVSLSGNSTTMLVVEYSRAIRIVRLWVKATLPWVVSTMFKIDLWKFCSCSVITCWTMAGALSRMSRYSRHVSRTHVVDGVESVRTFACIKRSVHPLLSSFRSSRILKWRIVGSCGNSRVIQIETIWLLQIDSKTRVQLIIWESLVRKSHCWVVLINLLCCNLMRIHVETGWY